MSAERSWARRAVFLGAVALGLLAALPIPSAAAQGVALLRLVHASPASPTVTVGIDGQRVISAMSYTESTPYVTVSAGQHRVTVSALGSAPGTTPLLDERLELREDNAYTVVGVEETGKMLSLLLDDTHTAPAPDRALIRVIQASLDAPPVVDIASADGPVVIRNLASRAAAEYAPIVPGRYRFEVRPGGTTFALATTAPIDVAAGRQYTIVVVGRLGDNSFQALALIDNARSGGVGGLPTTGGGIVNLRMWWAVRTVSRLTEARKASSLRPWPGCQ